MLSNNILKDIWHTGTISRAYGVISSDFVPFLLQIWKVNEIENGDLFHFFLPRNGPNGQTQRGWKKFLIICYYFDQVSYSNFKRHILCKNIRENRGKQFTNFKSILTKGRVSADVLYQMVGLFDDIKALSFYVQYIWEPFWSL